METPVQRNTFIRCFFVFVVSHHEPWCEQLYLSVFGDAYRVILIRMVDRSDFSLSLSAHVKVVEVLYHTVPFEKFEAQVFVPLNELPDNWPLLDPAIRTQSNIKPFNMLLSIEIVEDGDIEEKVDFARRHLFKDAVLG